MATYNTVRGPTRSDRIMNWIRSHGRLFVPFVVAVLVGMMLRETWHAIQTVLRMIDAPEALVFALPAALEPATILYAGVWQFRRKIGGDIRVVRALFFATTGVSLLFNAVFALPLDVLLPAGSPERMGALAAAGILAPLTIITMGHTGVSELVEWWASRRKLVEDVVAAVEAEARESMARLMREKHGPAIEAALEARLDREMRKIVGGVSQPRKPKAAKPTLSAAGVSANGTHPDGGPGSGGTDAPAGGSDGGGLVELVRTQVGPDVATAVEEWVSGGNHVRDRSFRGHLLRSIDGKSETQIDRYAKTVRKLAGAR